jgi:hypothetical protein
VRVVAGVQRSSRGVFVGSSCKVSCNGPSIRLPRRNRLTDKPCANRFSVRFTPSRRTPYDFVSRVQVPELVTTVSNAGGLGIFAAPAQSNPSALRDGIMGRPPRTWARTSHCRHRSIPRITKDVRRRRSGRVYGYLRPRGTAMSFSLL